MISEYVSRRSLVSDGGIRQRLRSPESAVSWEAGVPYAAFRFPRESPQMTTL